MRNIARDSIYWWATLLLFGTAAVVQISWFAIYGLDSQWRVTLPPESMVITPARPGLEADLKRRAVTIEVYPHLVKMPGYIHLPIAMCCVILGMAAFLEWSKSAKVKP